MYGMSKRHQQNPHNKQDNDRAILFCGRQHSRSSSASLGGGGDGIAAVIAGGGSSSTSTSLRHANNHSQNNNKSASHLLQAHSLNSSRTDEVIIVGAGIESASAGELNTMAGDIRLVDGKKRRKTWTLTDRSAMSVHLLKANLAEDGCDEAQLDMAKKLLESVSDPAQEESRDENSQLAVYWLIKSSEQGNDEATRLLKESLAERRGITGQNILDVQTCITTSTNEKLTFRAARLLYQKFNNGEEFITTNQLLAYLRPPPLRETPSASNAATDNKDLDKDDSLSSTDEFFTFIQDASDDEGAKPKQRFPYKSPGLNTTFTYARPEHPAASKVTQTNASQPTSSEDTPNESDVTIQNESMVASKAVILQEGVKLTLERLLKAASYFNSGCSPYPTIDSAKKEFKRHEWKLFSFLNLFVIQTLITATFCGHLGFQECLVLTMTFFTVWSAYNLLLWEKKYSNFKDWSNAFGSVLKDRKWNDELADIKLSLNLLLPYLLCHTIAFLVSISIEGFNPLKMVVGLLVIFSLSRGVIKTRGPRWKVIFILCLSSLSNISGTAIVSIDKLLDIGGFGDYHVSSWMEETYTQVHKMLPPLPKEKDMAATSLQLILITSLVWTRRSLLIQEVFPELLCALWVFKVFQISSKLLTIEIFVCIAVFCLLATVLVTLESRMKSWKVPAMLCLVCALTLSAILGVYYLSPSDAGVSSRSLLRFIDRQKSTSISNFDISKLKLISWEDYEEHCHKKAWRTANVAETQMKCNRKYGGSAVQWNTRLSMVKVKDMDEKDVTFELSLNIINPEDKDNSPSWQSFLPGSDKDHHLAPAVVVLSTAECSTPLEKQRLIDHILSFRSGDRIEFHGVLSPISAGSIRPEIGKVYSFRCMSCSIVDNHIEYFVKKSHDDSVHDQHLHSGGDIGESFYLHVITNFWKTVESLKSHLIV